MATTPPTNDHFSEEEVDDAPLFSVDAVDDATKQQIIRHVTTGHGRQLSVMQPFPQAIVDLFTAQFPPPQPHEPTSPLGRFGKLAIELQWMVLLQMDITTLIRFGQTCTLARTIVRTLPEFRTVTTYAGTTLFMALLATRLSDYFPIARVHDALTTWQCTECGYCFGDFVFLPYLERYCVDCLTSVEVNKKCRLRGMAWKEKHVSESRTPPCVIRSWQNGRPVGLGLVVFPTKCQYDYIPSMKAKDVHIRGNNTWWTVLNLGPPPPLLQQRGLRARNELAALQLYNPWRLDEDRYYTRGGDDMDWAFKAIPPKEIGLALSIAVPYLANARTGEIVSHGVRCRGLRCEEEGIWLPSEYVEEHFPWCEGAVDEWKDRPGAEAEGQPED